MDKKALFQIFKKNAEQVQAKVLSIVSQQQAIEYTIQLALDSRTKALAGVGLNTGLDQILDQECRINRIERLKPPLRHQAENIHIALTCADWGIADTGSLVLYSDSEDLRIATMLADTHVAILDLDAIYPHLENLEQEIDPVLKKNQASYTAVITGPSRTADIERILAIGVHGPQELHILVWGDWHS